MRLWQELRRRRVFRLIGVYIVGAWLAIQVAATFFPAWGIPDTALRYLIMAAVLGFPIAIVFGWLFDVTGDGIVRTASAIDDEDYSLKRSDYLILGALTAVSLAVLYSGYQKVQQVTTSEVAASEADPNSIAVLPFLNLDDNVDTEYFSDGVTEEVLHKLSSFKSLRVLGRSSSFAFKASDMTIAKISSVLNVRYLLQGSVRREANQIRVTARLVDDTGYQVWSETFDRELVGVFSIQTDIANAVAQSLVAEIVPREASQGSVTENMEAYQEYLIGRDHLYRRQPGWQKGASDAFARAIALDPEYAPPYAGLAVATGIGAGGDDPEKFSETVAMAQSYIDKALALDPELAEAHAAQGLILTFGLDADFAASEAALRRAIDLDPTVIGAYNWLSIALGSQGKFEESRIAREDALRIDPLNPIINVNVAMQYASDGDFYGAEKLYLRLMELPDPPGTIYANLHGLYNEYGRLVDANIWAKKLLIAYNRQGSANRFLSLSLNYRYLGMDEEADYWHAKLAQSSESGMNTFVRLAYALKLHGKYVEMKTLSDEFLRDNPVDLTTLPVFFTEVFGAIKIIVGDYAEGIELMEKAVDPDKPVSTTRGGGLGAIDFMQLLAYAYLETGQKDKASDVLAKTADHLRPRIGGDSGKSPAHLQTLALNQVMQGEHESATATLERAVQAGWRNYLFVVNDPRWGNFLERPATKSLMAFVKSDLDRQRGMVEKIDAEEDFRAIVAELEANSKMDSR